MNTKTLSYYIGVKLVKAEPEKRLAGDGETWIDGFKVTYADGYNSWCPLGTFELANIEVTGITDASVPSITQEMVDAFISSVEVTTLGSKTTIVRATLVNGFDLVESSACVNPENYN
jgi:hypothetical protein